MQYCWRHLSNKIVGHTICGTFSLVVHKMLLNHINQDKNVYIAKLWLPDFRQCDYGKAVKLSFIWLNIRRINKIMALLLAVWWNVVAFVLKHFKCACFDVLSKDFRWNYYLDILINNNAEWILKIAEIGSHICVALIHKPKENAREQERDCLSRYYHTFQLCRYTVVIMLSLPSMLTAYIPSAFSFYIEQNSSMIILIRPINVNGIIELAAMKTVRRQFKSKSSMNFNCSVK